MDIEEWRDAFGLPDYKISESGRLINLRTNKELGGTVNSYGYIQYTVRKNNKIRTAYAHILVAEAFLPMPDNASDQVCHIDEDGSHNHWSNLIYRPRKAGRHRKTF